MSREQTWTPRSWHSARGLAPHLRDPPSGGAADALRSTARPAQEIMARHLRSLIGPCIGVAWTAYAAVIAHLFRGRELSVPPVIAAFFGILSTLVTAAWNSAGFMPPEWFTVCLNWHFCASLLTFAPLVWLARTFASVDGSLSYLSQVFTGAWILIGFAILTAEIVDLYAQFIRLTDTSGALPFKRLMVLAAAWTLYGGGRLRGGWPCARRCTAGGRSGPRDRGLGYRTLARCGLRIGHRLHAGTEYAVGNDPRDHCGACRRLDTVFTSGGKPRSGRSPRHRCSGS